MKRPDPTTGRGRQALKRFLNEFDRGDTHEVLAARYEVDRSTIRTWLKDAGVDPQLNVKRRRAAREEELRRQLRKVQALQGQRAQAMINLQALADEYGVKPLTLAHWAERTGHYKPGVKVNLRAGRPRSLPRRRSGPGAELAVRVERAAAPWTPRHVAGLIRASARALT